jgi:aminoglycoside 3-N-acetyltransferase
MGGADAVLDGLLAAGCTILVPAFTGSYAVVPPDDMLVERNGWDAASNVDGPNSARVFSPATTDIDADMGGIPAALVARAERRRGNHPLDSFAALGPRADHLVSGQRLEDVYAPLRELEQAGGWVVLMGVPLTRMTLLHLAEERAGRSLCVRWARGVDGSVVPCRVGTCSEGFAALDAVLEPIMHSVKVGGSLWRTYPAAETLELAADAIRRHPAMTHCGNPACERCDDAVAGGPLLT